MLAYVIFFLYLCARFCALVRIRTPTRAEFEVKCAVRRETKTSKIYVYEIQCIEF